MKDVCKHLRELSGYVRNWLVHQPGVKEESLTDWLLYDVSQRLPNVHYKAFTRHEEARTTGADWEWWILFQGGAARFRVQAKKMVDGSDLNSEIARTNKYGLQIDMLLSSATRANAIPFYALYSTTQSPLMCAGTSPDGTHNDGVFIAGARKIHNTVFGVPRRAVSPSDILQISNPFSCFACCPLVHDNRGGLRHFLERYYPAETQMQTDSLENSSAIGSEDEEQFPGFHKNPPGYVTSLTQSKHEKLPDWWEHEYSGQLQEFKALLVYDFRSDKD